MPVFLLFQGNAPRGEGCSFPSVALDFLQYVANDVSVLL
jgi:hypothetical protein